MSSTLSTVQAARMLGRTPHTLWRWCKSGRIASTQDPVTGAFVIPETALEPFVQRGLIKTEIKVERKLLTLEQAAFELNMSKKDVQKLIDKRAIDYFAGPPLRIPVRALDDFIEASTISRKTRGRI